jgi:addiction module HigA family antidote
MKTNVASSSGLRPVHPGEILKEEFLGPMQMSAKAFADAIHVPANRITTILAGKRSVTANTALRFSRALGTTPEFWMNLQQGYELQIAKQAAKPIAKQAAKQAAKQKLSG